MRTALRWLGVAGLLAASTAAAAPEGLVQAAWYWQLRGREDKAAEAWERVLAVDADHAEALGELIGARARAGQKQEALRLLHRLREAHPDEARLEALGRAAELGERFQGLLEQARQLARRGDLDEAIRRYQEAFAGPQPPGFLALEYFETAAGTAGAWAQACAGLEEIASRFPGEPRPRLSLARVLSYRAETRAEALRRLAALDAEPASADEARIAWRKALGWLPESPAVLPALRHYLARHPEDAEMAARARLIEGQGRRGQLLRQAAKDLEAGRLDAAEKALESLGGSRSDSADVLAQLGFIRLRQRRFEEAAALLGGARAKAPSRAGEWAPALATARFWGLMDEVGRARESGELSAAESKLLEAAQVLPEERRRAEIALAEVHAAQGRLPEALAGLRALVHARSDDAEALLALIQLLAQAQQYPEAIALNRKLAALDAAKALPEGKLVAEHGRLRAQAEQASDPRAAADDLAQAHRADPANVWVLIDLANVALQLQELELARTCLEKIAALQPGLPAARIVEARLAAAGGKAESALAALESIDGPLMDDGLRDFKRRLQTQIAVEALVRRARQGGGVSARSELGSLEVRVADRPEELAVVAAGWSQLGRADRAVAALRRALESSSLPTPGLRLQLASALLELGKSSEAEAILDQLAEEKLSAIVQQGAEALRVAAAVRGADQRREAWDERGALEVLEPRLSAHPDDPRLLAALGRLFEQSRGWGDARAAFERALEADPADPDARRGAVTACLELGELEPAAKLLDEGLQRHPQSPSLHLLAGRLALRQDREEEAENQLRATLRLTAAAQPDSSSGDGLLAHAAERFEAGRDRLSSLIRSAAEEQLAVLEERRRPHADAQFELRRRSGEDGLGALSELRLPIAAGIAAGRGGRLTLEVTPTELDAGLLADDSLAARFGSGQALPSFAPGKGFSQQANGIAAGLGYTGHGLLLDLGSTPLGFPLQSAVGGASYRAATGGLRWSVELSRRAVTDSLLSFAGARDPQSGKVWGGVVRQGGRVELALEREDLSYLFFGGFHLLNGTEVLANRSGEAGLGARLRLFQDGATSLTAGLSWAGFGYSKNLRYFTLGQGGYFSPQLFLHAGLPIAFRREGRLRLEVEAEPGANWFRESASPAFPLSGQAVADPDSLYPAGSSSGFAFDARALIAYRPVSGLEARLGFEAHQAPDYQEVRAGISLHYLLPQAGSER